MRSSFQDRVVINLLIWIALLFGAQATFAQDTSNLLPVTEAYKLSADASTPGVVKLHWTIAQDYYLYRGRMNFKGGDGVTLGTAQLPDGEKHDDPYLGPVETYHHSIDATIPYTLAPGTTRLTLSVRYQGCHETDPKICYPPHTEQLDLPVAATAGTANKLSGALGSAPPSLGGNSNAPLPAEQAFHFDAIAQDAHHLLLRWTMPKGYYLYRDQTTLSLQNAPQLSLAPTWPAGTLHQDAHFGNTTVYFDEVDLPVTVNGDVSTLKSLALTASFQGCQDGGLCYPLMTREATVGLDDGSVATGQAVAGPAPEMPPAGVKSESSSVSFWYALLLALGGGLVLNLMPCVLPVLSIKAVSLIESGESPARRRSHALMYTAGVLISFVSLGLAIIALKSAWGTQLQNPLVVAALSLVMLAVALSMSGVVQFGASLGNTGSSLANRSGAAGDFFTGVLAVVVASPCTAPFMGSALAYAFVAPTLSALVVFVALGLGLALPFLAVGFVPALSRWLPRPGRWMETLKEVLAFPMYLTAAWLAWVLAHQRGADAVGLLMVAAVMLAMTLWWLERSRGRGWLSRACVALLALLTLAPMYYLATLPATAQATELAGGIVAYSPEKLADLRKQGVPVFVDMTADWCVTCKANEHAVLDGETFQALLKRTGAVYMKGDWTDVNPTISTFLQQYHSPGVPLYVVFPKDGGPGKQLPTVLTSSLVEQALTEAAK
ncbi:protein-disulfide reductase DsbD family protein [Dyella psychrodurans]|uniref:Protein-disulfide reductase n=1 Tax=Dyella psychrodurans TaxID=1927960 RepID=A0A370WX10_9GAMM|nr:protein-disulfide reductase DsbD [Dyella psychrodurans]RDS80664.1 protein-disulfide reductase [Dyella psychrodurans]